ncbi:BgTH12-00603 [Blumeria graminis f. sp. triticale]|nr:BgTH12-00603 [Blumeria graminis f. sp. triticale]
MDRPCA